MKTLSKEAQEIITDLKEQGFDNQQIADAMCDGEYLEKESISKKVSNEIYFSIGTL